MTKYEMIRNDIKNEIISKRLVLGDRVPSEAELCKQYDVSRITAKRALTELTNDGYIKRVNGSGSYVSYQPIHHLLTGFYSLYDELLKCGRKPHSKMLAFRDMLISQIPFSADVMNQLQLYDYDHVYFLKRLRYADQEIIALDYTFFPVKYIPSLREADFEDEHASLFSTLKQRYDLVPDRAQECFGVCSVSKRDAADLEVTPHTPALVNTRVSYYHGIPIEYNHRICKGESYKYTVNLEMR